MDSFLDGSFHIEAEEDMAFSNEFSLNSSHDFGSTELFPFRNETFSAFSGAFEEMDITDRYDSNPSTKDYAFGAFQNPPALVEDDDVMEVDLDCVKQEDPILSPCFDFASAQSLQSSMSRPSVIVSIPKDRLFLLQNFDHRICQAVKNPSVKDEVYRHKKRTLASDFDAANDSIIVRNYLVRAGLHSTRDMTLMPAAKQSPYILAAIEHCFFDLGWEQVRIRLVLQYIFGMKENNAKSRVSKVIKDRKKEKSEPRGVKRKLKTCADDEGALAFDEDTEDLDVPPLKKSRSDLNNLGMD
jgi:hypothetical protein